MNPAETQTSGEFRRGWPVLSACLIGIGLGLSPLPFYTLGVFAPHLAKEFGWTTAQIMGGLSVTTLSVIVSGPAAGILAERYGTRRVALTSLVLFGFAFMAMALVGNSIIQYYLLWGLIALVGAGTLPITFTRTTNRWFDKHRGIALGVAMTGTGIFGILCKPYLAWIIGDYGWRAGYVALGALPLLIALPICLLLFRDPPEAGEAGHRPAAALTGMFRGEAMRSWRFRLIAFAMIIIPFCLAGPVPNLEGILRDRGFDGPTILSLTPLIGLSAIAGRLIGGLLLDRFWAPGVAFVMLSLPAIACLILAGSGYSPVLAAVAICMIGFALGIEYDIIAYLTSRYFGLRAYGGLYAILYVCFSVGSGLAPMIFGLLRDTGGDFAQALTISAIALPLASALFLLLGRYPVFKDAPA
jgi:MFS family permease